MNKKQLKRLGVPDHCIPEAIQAIQSAALDRKVQKLNPKRILPQLLANPGEFLSDRHFQQLARAVMREKPTLPRATIEFRQWGEDIDEASRQQMRQACRLPVAVGAALMPDAHVGYGLPIGGVLACDNAVVPYAVGVDIACRMRLTVTDLPLTFNDPADCQPLDAALQQGTRFGAGKSWPIALDHGVMDEDWDVTAITRQVKDTARQQLGTSGSGNHFVEWGILELPAPDLGLAPGNYVSLLSHSGSRGAGAQVCRRYTDIARQRLPTRLRHDAGLQHLAWLSLDTQEGQEYWSAMNLMGQYAAANHELIHARVTKLTGAQALAVVENHHNFAWKEQHGGRDLIVHRKGATPAQAGVLGVIPGSMSAPGYVVRGRGEATSYHSAAHGAGRAMSRTAAKQQFRWHMWRDHLKERGVRVLAAGIDEAPGAYKDIHSIMSAQADLVEIVATFHPKIVMMCGDGSRAED